MELMAEREMISTGFDIDNGYPENDRQSEESEYLQNFASNPTEDIGNDGEVSIKNEIDELVMPQDMHPEEDILENIKSETGDDSVKETEASKKNVIETEEEQHREEFKPEKVLVGFDFEPYHANTDGQTEELEEFQSTESCNINSSEYFGQMDKNVENVCSINNCSVVSTSGISGINKAKKEMCERSSKDDFYTEEESFLSLKSKSGDNSAKSGSSSSGMSVQRKKKGFVCDVCKKSFTSKTGIRRHVRIHYDERPFKCRECGKLFKQESGKVVHELRHLKKQKEIGGDENISTEKSHVREICNKGFSKRYSLQKHSNQHKDKYLCTFCGKRFSCNRNLIRHCRIHTNVKPFSCEVCKRTFNRKENLKSHLLTHSDNRSFQCKVCDKRFKSKSYKNLHELFHLMRK